MYALISVLALLSCTDGDYVQLYNTESKAPSLELSDIGALEHMGPTVVDGGVNFALWSDRATRIDVLLFDDPEAERPTQRFELERIEGSAVWNLFVEGIGYGQHYGFVAWGPNWEYSEDWRPGRIEGFKADVDAEGNRFNPNKLLIDPYTKAIHRDHDWSKGSTGTGPARTSSTWGAAAKSIVVETDTYTWSDQEAEWLAMRQDPFAEGHSWSDLVIYEVHAKGFTANAASGVDNPGTYRGIGEKAAYLQDLGITAIELLPVHEKPLDGGYWGYNNLNFFSLELQYSAAFTRRGEPTEVIDEFKWMVDELHKHDIEVFVDVVYNHTGEGGLWREKLYYNDTVLDPTTQAASFNLDPKEVAGLYSFRGLDNNGYYALSPDKQSYWNNTGVGNQTRPNNEPMERLILDSLRYQVEELHVDGFRFDLAGILGEKDGDYNNWYENSQESVLGAIVDDPVMQKYNVRIISEPWTAGGNYGPLIGAYPSSTNLEGYGWLEWNARFRDWWRDFLNDDNYKLNSKEADADGGFVMTGSQHYYDWNGRLPYTSVNFITAHDGFTMYDLFSFYEKQNGCGVLNPVCCDDPTSAWCETDSGDSHNRSRDWGDETMKRAMMRNAFTAMAISQGTPMMLGGDEWMRTQYGNNNAYSNQADNEWNWHRWGEWQADNADFRHRMHDFVRDLWHFRKAHTYAFNPPEWGGQMPLAWKNPANHDGVNWGGKALMMHFYDDGNWPDEAEIIVAINNEAFDTVDFSLPEGRTWGRVIDTQTYFDSQAFIDSDISIDPKQSHNIATDAPEIVSGTYSLPPRAIAIFVEQ